MKLKDVINNYAAKDALTRVPNLSAGSDDTVVVEEPAPPVSSRHQIDRDSLSNDLQNVKKDNNRYFLVCVVMVVLLFLVSIVVVLTNLSRPEVVTVVMSAFGVSTAGLIWLMIKLWREKSNTEFLLVIATHGDADSISKVLDILARRLPK